MRNWQRLIVSDDEWAPVREFVSEGYPSMSLMDVCERITGMTLLCGAIESEHIEVARLLMQSGDVDVSNRDIQVSMVEAVEFDDAKMVEMLLEHGIVADFNTWIEQGISPRVSMLNVLKRFVSPKLIADTFIHSACFRGYYNELQWHLRHGAAVQLSNSQLAQLFMNHHRVMEVLVEHGINLNALDDKNATVLDHVLYQRDTFCSFFQEKEQFDRDVRSVIDYLIPRGARLNVMLDPELQQRINATHITKHKLASLV